MGREISAKAVATARFPSGQSQPSNRSASTRKGVHTSPMASMKKKLRFRIIGTYALVRLPTALVIDLAL